MKSKLGSPLVIAIALVMSSGCSVKSLVKQIEKEGEKQADIVCPCLDGEAEQMCYDQAVYSYSDCEIDALKEDSKASKETLNCLLDASKEMTECYEDNIDCDDPLSTLTCLDILEQADCPELPSEVQEALSACDDGQ
jgi:hypothetical protein